LLKKIRQICLYRQAEHTQNEVKDDQLVIAIISAEPPEQLSKVLVLFQSEETQF